MPSKQTKAKQPYRIDGRKLYWQPEDDDGVRGNLPEVAIPMRIKLGVLRDFDDQDMSPGVMFRILEKIIPGQADAIDDMDLNDFMAMFRAWQAEYNLLNGASLGE